jgi:glycosyltransferase involved in cell wall biosynthesis
MNIAISTSVIQRGRTGVAQYVFALVKALLSHAGRHDIHLLVLEEDLPLFDFVAGRMTVVPVSEKYRPPVRNIAWHHTVLPRWLQEHQIDVLHVPSYRRMLRSAPCALVATIHDLAQFHVARKYDCARMLYGRVLARYLANCQDQIIAISQSTAQDIERFFYVPPHKIHIIYNGVDRERFRPGDRAQAKADAAARWALNRPFFLYVSRIEHPAKNHVRLIEAFNRFRATATTDWQLALVGSNWHGSDVIHATAQSSPFSRDIRFLGFVDDATLPTIYRAAEAMVYPSLFEGFGLPPVEAMACGCPVLTSRCGSLAEVVGESAGIFDPEQVDDIVAALKRVTTDLRWCAHLRDSGMLNAQRFNWNENAQRTMRVYEQAIECHQASRSRSVRITGTNINTQVIQEHVL